MRTPWILATITIGLLFSPASTPISCGQTVEQSEQARTLHIRLVAQQQSDDYWNEQGTQIGKVVAVRITTKDILNLLSDAVGTDFTGGHLEAVDWGSSSFYVRDGTNLLADVSQYFGFVTASDLLWTGRYDGGTEMDHQTQFSFLTLTFNDGAGNGFNVGGYARERYDSRGYNRANVATTVYSMALPAAAGEGALGYAFALFHGEISAQGKWTRTFTY